MITIIITAIITTITIGSLNYWINEKSNNITDGTSFNILTNVADKYSEYPLNLLTEIDQLATVELMFLSVLLNC